MLLKHKLLNVSLNPSMNFFLPATVAMTSNLKQIRDIFLSYACMFSIKNELSTGIT